MALPQRIPVLAQPAIASYDFQDIAKAVGYETYYLAVARDSTQSAAQGDRILSPLVVLSDLDAKEETTTTTGAGTTRNYDSSTFKLPRVVSGDLIFSTCLEAANTETQYLNIYLKKVDSLSTETIIASLSGGLGLSANTPHTQLLKEAVTQTNISRGDKLRLTIQQISNGGVNVAYGSDPGDRDGAVITPSTSENATTITKILVPFRIDIS